MSERDLKESIEISLETINRVLNNIKMLPKEVVSINEAMDNIHSSVLEYLNDEDKANVTPLNAYITLSDLK